MTDDHPDPLDTMPSGFDEFRESVKVRDKEIIRFIDTNHRLMLAKFDETEGRFNRIETNLSENTRETKQISSSVSILAEDAKELLDAASAAKGAFKVLNWIGALAKPLGYIAIFIGSVIGIWTAIKTGTHPK